MALAAAAAALWSGTAVAATFTVNTTDDATNGVCDLGHCSLREAIAAANADAAADVVAFAIGEGGFQTITVSSQLPIVAAPLFIDGFSQPGGTGTAPEIAVRAGGSIEVGIWITASDSRVRGLVVNGFSNWSALIESGDRNVLEANYLGTDSSGLLGIAGGNFGGLGIRSGASESLIGGSGGDGRNVIANGIVISGTGSANNVLLGNYVGVGADGSTRINTNPAADGIVVDGAPGTQIGRGIAGLGNVVSGNVDGIVVNGSAATSTVIVNNLVGTNAAGTAAQPNSGHGIQILGAPSVVVGGTGAADRNVVSGNGMNGIYASSAGGVRIQGNYVGTTSSGAAALANGGHGVYLLDSPNSFVGRTTGGNVVSGNALTGITLAGTSSLVVVQGNRVGTNAGGIAAVPNGTIGIRVAASNARIGASGGGSLVGGIIAGALNTVAGNLGHGILLEGSNGIVDGNAIGVGAGGVAIPNGGAGVHVAASSNNVGGNSSEGPNEIANNAGAGIGVTSGFGNNFSRNRIRANGGLGIDLAPAGVTPNDPGDADSGANLLNNFPVLTSVSESGGTTTVSGTINTAAGAAVTIQLYANASCDGSGHGEGATFFATVSVTTDASGNAAFTASGPAAAGAAITATAFSGPGGTSEFSACATATPAPSGALVVNSTDDADDGACTSAHCSLREAINAANAAAGVDTIGFALTGSTRIAPTSSLPSITDAAVIDGTTQLGWSGRPLVELDGSAGAAGFGLNVRSSGASTVKGLIVHSFPRAGIALQTGAGSTLTGSWIGIDATGTVAKPNGEAGVMVTSASGGDRIGGNAASDRNVIAGNAGEGIYLEGGGSAVIENNLIGLRPDGDGDLPNGGPGVRAETAGNEIGDDTGNTIAGNGEAGVALAGDDNRVTRNTLVRNEAGVSIDFSATGNVVQDNEIGSSLGAGIVVYSGSANRFSRNRIDGNGALGIDLGANGPTLTEPDGTPVNAWRLPPRSLAATPVDPGLEITGIVDGSAGTHVVDLYRSPVCDPSGYGEGAQHVEAITVTVPTTGSASFTAVVPVPPTGHVLTATVTDPVGNTSEFSACFAATAPPTVEKITSPAQCTSPEIDGATLGFDELTPGTNVATTYATSHGVRFLDDALRTPYAYSHTERVTSSPPTSVALDADAGGTSVNLPLVIDFDRDQTAVGFRVGNQSVEPAADTILTAYDASGAVIGSVEHTVAGNDVLTFLGIRTLGAPIRRVALDFGETLRAEEIDDLCFRRTEAPLVATLSNLALAVDETTIRAGVARVPLSAIPATWIPFISGGSVPRPVNAPIGDIPIGDIPIGDIPIGDIPIGDIPIGDIPIGDIPIGDIAGPDDPLREVLLSSLPSPALLDVVAGTALEGRPFQALTLRDVYNDPVARARFEALTVASSGLAGSLIGGLSVPAVLLGGASLAQLPAPSAGGWCGILGNACSGVNLAQATVAGLELTGSLPASTPIGDIPIGDIPIGDIPIGDIPIGDISLAGSRLAAIRLADLVAPGAVVDCARVDCATGTLGDAAALSPSAILPTATLAGLVGAFGSVTVGEVVVALVARSDLRWTAFDPNGMQPFAGTGETAHYRATMDATCASASDVTVRVDLPPGFLVVPGSSRLLVDTDPPTPVADPTHDVEFGTGWLLPGACTATPRRLELRFEAYAGLELGTHTASARARTPGGIQVAVTGAAPITVTQNHEQNETRDTARPIAPNELVVLHVGSSLDRETFTLPNPPRGWIVEATLDQVPADADLDLSATVPPGPAQLPIGDISLGSLPLSDPGSSLVAPDSRTLGAETLHDIPVPSSPTSTPIGDIPIGDIPIGDIPIGDISARRSSEAERVRLVSTGTSGPITLEVSGYNGASSSEHAVLGVRLIPPPPLPPCPPKRFAFDADPYGGADEAQHAGTLPASLPSATKTIFLVARNRMYDAYGPSTADMLSALATVAARPEVGGYVLDVEWDTAVRDALRTRDANPCVVDAVNAVPRAVNALVARYRDTLPQLRNLVVVGGDEQLAMARVADLVTLSPEFDYAKSLAFTTNGLREGNALYASAALGYFLTDDSLATFRRAQWRDRELYLPELATSRLVETPDEIRRQLDRYVAAGGRLDPATLSAVTAEIPFLTEGTATIANAFSSRVGAANLLRLGGPWDSVALLTGRDGRGLWSLNAHHDHFRLQPESLANGMVGAGELLPVPADPALPAFRSLVSVTMGCHAGTPVSDDLIASPDTVQALRLRDLAQANAQQQAAVYVANTGFGYGETAPGLSGYSERLFAIVGEELMRGAGSFGEALVRAKHRFFRESGTYNDFDFKVLQQATLYGLGLFALDGGGSVPAPPPAPPTETDLATDLKTLTFDFSVAPSLVRTDTPEGSFWSAGGNASIAHYRMPQPLVTRDFQVAGFEPRGVELVALATNDVPNVDPFLSTPTVACPECEPEAPYTDAIYPASFVTLNTSRLFGERRDTLALVAGQFRPTTPAGERGVERLVQSASVKVYSSSSTDRSRPLFVQTGATAAGGQTTIWAKVADRGTGVKKVSVLWTRGGADPWHYRMLEHVSGALYAASVATTDEIHVMYTAIDGGGNSGFSTKKGFLITSHAADAEPPRIDVLVPAPEQVVLLNQQVPAAYACTDADGVRNCAGTVANRAPISTATVGTHTFTVEGEDLAGNRSTASVQYTVVHGMLTFLPPLVSGLNTENAGRTIPVKWQLRDGADAIVSKLSVVAGLSVQPLDCATRGPSGAAAALPLGELRYAGNHFHYNWRTLRSQVGGCFRFAVELDDGSKRGVDFRLR